MPKTSIRVSVSCSSSRVSRSADDFYGRESNQLLQKHLSSKEGHGNGEFAMAGFRLDQTLSDHGAVPRVFGRNPGSGLLWPAGVVREPDRRGNSEAETEVGKNELRCSQGRRCVPPRRAG